MTDKNSKKNKSKINGTLNQVNTPEKSHNLNNSSIGVDIGTSKIVVAVRNNGRDQYSSQRNAFITVDYSKFTENILKQNQINHNKTNGSLLVYGDGAEVLANMLNTETRRPMRNGLLNPTEANAIEIIRGISDDLVPSSKNRVSLRFSIPGVQQDNKTDIIYHEAILKRHLDGKGYNSSGINEGLAVIFSELEKDNFTGIGISAGGGLCNVCLAYLSVPLISFSVNKGGDFIDYAVASVTSEVSTRVRDIKENELNLMKEPANEIEEALHIYYDNLIMSLVKDTKESIARTSKFPKVDAPIPIVLSGGTAKPNGFKERFEKFLKEEGFPLKISNVRIADDPLNATAKGALIAAMCEN